jgi:hypothetical protein
MAKLVHVESSLCRSSLEKGSPVTSVAKSGPGGFAAV